MSQATGKKKGFNSQEFIGRLLSFTRYLRFSVLLLASGLMAGVAYYVFSDALYFSRGLINIRMFDYAVDSDEDAGGKASLLARRSLANQLKSKHLLKQTAVHMGVADDSASAAEIQERLIPKVRIAFEDNRHLQIEVYSTSPKVVRDYPGALIETFFENESRTRKAYRQQAVTNYVSELREIKQKLAQRLEAKSKFEEENALVDVFVAQKQLSQIPVEIVWIRHRLTQMDEMRSALKGPGEEGGQLDRLGKLALLTSFSEEMPEAVGRIVRPEKEGLSPIAVESPDTVMKPAAVTERAAWERLEKSRRLAEERLELALETYGLEHPNIKGLQAEIATLESEIQLELETAVQQFDLDYSKLKAREQALQNQLPEYHEITRKYEQFRLDFELLSTSELAWDKAHQEISQRIAALEFGADKDRVALSFLGHTNLRDDAPVTPSKFKLLVISLVIGVALSASVPTLIEMFNDTASRLQQIESATGLLGLGVVPLCSRRDLENIVRAPTLGAKIPNQLLENFRIIRSNICLHPNHANRSQVTMVTSARPSEGKTTQAANIAWAFNSIGERTLLIDSDLRRGRLSKITKLDNSVGLTSILVGHVKPEEAIQTTGLENLDVITRGPIIAGSTEVLSQKFFEDLVTRWRGVYDRIVIDTPPVLGLSETGVVQRVADGVVLVVRAETTPQKDIVDAVELLRKSGAHMYGFVLNGIDLSRIANYYQYQYYSADYYADFEELEESASEAAARKPQRPTPAPTPLEPASPEVLRKPAAADPPGRL